MSPHTHTVLLITNELTSVLQGQVEKIYFGKQHKEKIIFFSLMQNRLLKIISNIQYYDTVFSFFSWFS